MSDQSMQALALANRVHRGGAKFRRMVAGQTAAQARITLARTLEHNGFTPEVGSLPLHKFLKSARGIGDNKAEKICNDSGLWRTNPRIRDLTLRERSALAATLRHCAKIIDRNNKAARVKVITADCLEAMADLDADSINAIICDPPYGLEFMGKEWDRLDAGLPQEAVWKGRRGNGGSNIGTDDTKPSSRHHVALGAGKQHGFNRCQICGRRQFSGTPCECEAPDFRLEYRQEAPSSSIRMGRWHEVWTREAYRILKPGAHLLAFGGTRTHHRLACAVEDAGFEIRDSLLWLYGSGFPKSLDVSKAIDKAAGAEREVVGTNPNHREPDTDHHERWNGAVLDANVTAPATPDAQQWQGWGTALKPSHEPIVVARKPLSGTVAANVLAHGTGALNIDATRINGAKGDGNWKGKARPGYDGGWEAAENDENPAGRWPPNVILSPESAAELDEQSGEAGGGFGVRGRGGDKYANGQGFTNTLAETGQTVGYGDTGGASRFFYCAKASRAERNAGLGGFEEGDARSGTRRH